MNSADLVKMAFEARENAYSPYSNYKVGAALLAKNGNVYQGCNIENATYTPTNCAERTAFFKAVSEGVRDFVAIAIVGGLDGTKNGEFEYAPPCGVCRQVMMEFCDYENFIVILGKSEEEYQEFKLKDVMPLGFSKKNLNK